MISYMQFMYFIRGELEMSQEDLIKVLDAVPFPSDKDIKVKIVDIVKTLEDTKTYQKLLNGAIEQLSKTIKDMGIEDLNYIFDYFDEDNSGTIEKSELIEGFKNLGITLDTSLIKNIFRKFDENFDNAIEPSEFEKVL